jgi:putative transposase
MDKHNTTKPKNIDYFRLPEELWELLESCLPPEPKRQGPGRPRADNRAVWNAIWYHLWTGCQWKAIHRDWFGVCSSVIHARFQTWQRTGVFDAILRRLAEYYAQRREIGWAWQSVDSKSVPAPLAADASGRNPTDRGKQGSKLHLLVDEQGAPLALHVTGANEHDKWSADDLIISIVVDRPDPEAVAQHFCADKGYDYDDVHEAVAKAQYVAHIKHRRRPNEPVIEACPIPGELCYPARRWVVERTIGWLNKRRAIRTRWAKSAANWLALVQFACGHILFNMAFYG